MPILSPVAPIKTVAGLSHVFCTLISTSPTKWAISYRFRDVTTRVKIGFHQATKSEPVDFSSEKLAISAAVVEGWAHQSFARLADEFVQASLLCFAAPRHQSAQDCSVKKGIKTGPGHIDEGMKNRIFLPESECLRF